MLDAHDGRLGLRVADLDAVCDREEGDELVNVYHLVTIQVHLLHEVLELHVCKGDAQTQEGLAELSLVKVVALVSVKLFEEASQLLEIDLVSEHLLFHLREQHVHELLATDATRVAHVGLLHHKLYLGLSGA